MPYQNFAVIGAGNLGVNIVDALLEQKSTRNIASIVVVTRSVSSTLPTPLNLQT